MLINQLLLLKCAGFSLLSNNRCNFAVDYDVIRLIAFLPLQGRALRDYNRRKTAMLFTWNADIWVCCLNNFKLKVKGVINNYAPHQRASLHHNLVDLC